MRRSGDPKGTERTDFAAAKAEPAKHRFLPPREVRADPSQPSRHLQSSNFQVGPGFAPAIELPVGRVMGHFPHCTITKSLT